MTWQKWKSNFTLPTYDADKMGLGGKQWTYSNVNVRQCSESHRNFDFTANNIYFVF